MRDVPKTALQVIIIREYAFQQISSSYVPQSRRVYLVESTPATPAWSLHPCHTTGAIQTHPEVMT